MKLCEVGFNKYAHPTFINVTDRKNISFVESPKDDRFIVHPNDEIYAMCPGGMHFGTSFKKKLVGESMTRPTRKKTTPTTTLPVDETNQPIHSHSSDVSDEHHDWSSVCDPLYRDCSRKRRQADVRASYRSKSTIISKHITLTCVNNTVYGKKIETGIDFPDATSFYCHSKNRFEIFMKTGSGSCSHNYYALGIKVFDKIYEVLQICFDLRTMRPIFVRFLTKKERGSLNSYATDSALDKRDKWWETDNRYKTQNEREAVTVKNSSDYVDLELPNYNFFINPTKYKELIAKKFIRYADILFYIETSLYPDHFFGKAFNGIIPENFKLQTTLGWEALQHGNWLTFLHLFEERSKTVNYEVFIGTSHIAQAPKDEYCIEFVDLILRDLGKEEVIPQYIWAYIFNKNEKYVIVGVNTPYYPIMENSNVLPCISICNTIPWLKNLARFEKVSTLGLIYCCPPSSVDRFLHGFPRQY